MKIENLFQNCGNCDFSHKDNEERRLYCLYNPADNGAFPKVDPSKICSKHPKFAERFTDPKPKRAPSKRTVRTTKGKSND